MKSIRSFMREETGVTATEYGIILGCLATIVITGFALFFTNMGNVFGDWGTWFGSVAATVPK